MRIRTIKPEFFKHDGLSELAPLTRILFVGLWCLADRAGRLEDRPARIRVEVLPYDKCDVDKMLAELERAGFIIRYASNGLSLIQIPAFDRHQRITGKEAETPSRFPEPNGETFGKHSGNIRETPETTGNGRETEGKRKGKGMEGEGGDKARAQTLDEVRSFCRGLDLPDSDAEYLWEKWNGSGWKNGSSAIKDWRSTVRSWRVAGYLPSQKAGRANGNKPKGEVFVA